MALLETKGHIATLTFSLPEQETEFRTAIDGCHYKGALWDFSQWLRNKLKYGDHPAEVKKMLGAVHEAFYEAIEDNGVSHFAD